MPAAAGQGAPAASQKKEMPAAELCENGTQLNIYISKKPLEMLTFQ
jgi:hypothetical protein